MELFKNIAVAIITPTHTKKSFDMGLGLAKKHNATLSVIECVYKIPPKFYFFETKSDKKIAQSQVTKIKQELKKWKELAAKEGIKINTKFALTDSIAHWVIDYVKENKIDLLVVDYPKLSMIEATHHDDIINQIHHKAHCHVLTMKQ
ncbi:MAG: universal stress protein [Nitrosopumilaceae archaeon]|nr:universal stress protein [Nitrosopumilaceae archaeon]NIP10260.1 universal stress protein [Nitrosopumilaceae archaeon]NIS94403.1 universal stress protein [Nitrosopumilaceae archaeon]